MNHEAVSVVFFPRLAGCVPPKKVLVVLGQQASSSVAVGTRAGLRGAFFGKHLVVTLFFAYL